MEHEIDVLNEEMEAKGARLFAGGLRPASEAKALRSPIARRLSPTGHTWRPRST